MKEEIGNQHGYELNKLHYQRITMFPTPRHLKLVKEKNKELEELPPNCVYHILGKGNEPIDGESMLGRLRPKIEYLEDYPTQPVDNEDHHIKLAICVTLYNEGLAEFKATMKGIIRSMHEFYHEMKEPMNPQDICIFFVADGFDRMNQELLNYLKKYNWFDFDLVKEQQTDEDWYIKTDKDADGKEFLRYNSDIYFHPEEKKRLPRNNVVHLFQTQTNCHFGLEKLEKVCDIEKEDYLPFTYNVLFAIKHLNGQKLDSHLWFFRGFCGYIHPKFVLLLDLGTEPMNRSLTKLYYTMEKKKNCGGVCGEIEVDLKVLRASPEEDRERREKFKHAKCPYCLIWLFMYFLILLQFVEYKIAHFVDKACESFFGFVSVLPGAFSGYRWASVQGKPLDKYFIGLNKSGLNCFKANMYLAEDRIMCLSLITNPKRADCLYYVPGCPARTDPPTELMTLIKQRRRWINGSTFATFFVLLNFCSIWKTKHNCCRKLLVCLFFLINLLQTILTFVLVGCFYASFSIIVRTAFPDENSSEVSVTAEVCENLILLLILYIFTWSLCVDVGDEAADDFFWITSIILGGLYFFSFYCLGIYIYNEDGDMRIYPLILLFVLVLSLAIPIILNCCHINHVCQFWIGLPVYLFFTPLFLITLVMYSFGNIHDVTWGNRPEVAAKANDKDRAKIAQANKKKGMEFKKYRAIILLIWCTMNLAMGYCITQITRGTPGTTGDLFFDIFLGYCAFIMIYRFFFSVLHRLLNFCTKLNPYTNYKQPKTGGGSRKSPDNQT